MQSHKKHVLLSLLPFELRPASIPMSRLHCLAICLIFLSVWAGCRSEPEATEYAARVGDQYLTEEEVSETLEALGSTQDTTGAREQIIEQWVRNALLYREAQRRDLESDPDVQEQLEDHKRSVLINELTARLHEDAESSPSDTDIQTYYDQHQEQLRLREPFVHVRHMATTTREEAETVQTEMQVVGNSDEADSTWNVLIREYAANPDEAQGLANNYYPESQVFSTTSTLRTQLERLTPGEMAPILEIDSLFHVVQLADRADAGTIPEREWVEDEIRRRLEVRSRKQMYAREVQRLRNEALAREELEIR